MTSHEFQAFGDLLRRYRVFAGMSQEELAARAGLSARAISDLERGVKRVPRRDTVQLLVEALQLSGEAQAAFVAAAREPAARPRATAPETPAVSAPVTPGLAAVSPHSIAQLSATFVAPGALPVGGFLGAAPARPLVGREAELADLLGAVEAAARGNGQLVTIAGEPGIGKTRLAQEVALACRERQFLIATGRCYEPHHAVPYYPFLEAISALVVAAPDVLRAELPARWPSLARLLPEQPTMAAPSAPSGASPQEEQQRLFWAVTGFLQALAEAAPVALLLDDLHWADDASLALLQHLARHTRALPVLLVCTYRDVEVGRQHPLERALRDLEREHLVQRIPVRRLAPEGTAQLIADLMGQQVSGEFAALVHHHTDGHPLFVQEVLRALIERGDIYRRDGRWERKEITTIAVPETVRATIADRVLRLSEPAQEALREASVLGQAFTFEDLHAMGDQSEEALDAALEEALAAGLAQETRDGYVFNHALTQQALYIELSTRRRRKLHLAAGAALERLPDAARQRRAAELAWHFREGSAPERALPYALLAGDYARALFATGEAEQQYRAAIQLAEELGDRASQGQALEKLGWLLWILARFDECAETLERATRVYQELGDSEGQIRAVGLLGMLLFTSAPLEGVRRITELLDRLGEQALQPSRPLASLYTSLAMNLHIAGQYRREIEVTERAVEVAERVGDTRMRTWAETTRGTALATLGDLTEGRRVGEQAIPVAEADNDYFGLLSAVHYLGELCAAQGDFAASTQHYTRALELAERLGAQSRISAETANLAEIAFYQGDWQRAREQAERAAAIARGASAGRAGSYFQYANVYRQLAMILAAQGDWERALPYLEESLALAERLPYPEAVRKGQRMLAERDLLLGRAEAALARLEPLMELAAAQGSITRLVPAQAWARAELGDLAGAERMLSEDIALARAQGHRLGLVDLLRVRGIVLARQDRREEAMRSLDEAVALAREMAYPYAEARALYEQGRAHAGAGEEPAARERFEVALAIFRRLGARPGVERTTRALAAMSRARKASAAGS